MRLPVASLPLAPVQLLQLPQQQQVRLEPSKGRLAHAQLLYILFCKVLEQSIAAYEQVDALLRGIVANTVSPRVCFEELAVDFPYFGELLFFTEGVTGLLTLHHLHADYFGTVACLVQVQRVL